jgi:hypothetical protein
VQDSVHECPLCNETFTLFSDLRTHAEQHRPSTSFEKIQSAFRRNVSVYRHTPPEVEQSVMDLVSKTRKAIQHTLAFELAMHRSVKASLIFHVLFEKDVPNANGEYERLEHCFRKKAVQLGSRDGLGTFINDSQVNAANRVSDYTSQGSGWVVVEILQLDIEVVKAPPLNGSCSKLSITNLRSLRKIKSHELQEPGNRCFLKCIAFHFTQNEDESVLDTFIRTHINWDSQGPVHAKAISKFEQMNEHLKLRINLLVSDARDVHPYLRSESKGEHCINLLLYTFKRDGEMVGHYMYIDNLNKLLRQKYVSNSGKLSYRKGVRCVTCLTRYRTEEQLLEHEKLCKKFAPQLVVVPEKGSFLSFNKYNRKYKVPIVGFLDFEAANQKNNFDCKKCKNEECMHQTVTPFTQKPICVSLVICTREREVLHSFTFTGDNAAERLLKELMNIEPLLLQHITQNNSLHMTALNESEFQNSQECHVCEKPLNGDKVRDHDHIKGYYMGAAHNVCNLKRVEFKKYHYTATT